MIKAVIFDMDGTTVDSVKSIAYHVNETLKKYGFPTIEVEKYNYFAGNGPKKLIERVFDHLGLDKSIFDQFFNTYVTEYNKNVLHLSEAFDGIESMLKCLKEKNIKTAIVSNKQDKAVKLISDALFGDLIDVSVGFTENVPLKPAPDSLFMIMKELEVQKDQVLFVGDTAVDIETAKNASVKSVGVLWGFRGEDELISAGADHIISSPDQILKLI